MKSGKMIEPKKINKLLWVNRHLFLLVFVTHILFEFLFYKYVPTTREGRGFMMYEAPLLDILAVYLVYLYKYYIFLLIGAAPIYSLIFYELRRYKYTYLIYVLYVLIWIFNISAWHIPMPQISG
jgi:hypothetical protein